MYVVGELVDEKAYNYLPSLRILDETKGRIRVVVGSPGGHEPGGFALFDTLRSLRNPVTTIGVGGIYSIAALVFQAGSDRILMPHSQLMMHNGTIPVEGGDVNTDLIEKLGREAGQNNARYHRAIAARSGIDLKQVEQWCKDERYFLAEEAVRLGLADRIIQSWKDS